MSNHPETPQQDVADVQWDDDALAAEAALALGDDEPLEDLNSDATVLATEEVEPVTLAVDAVAVAVETGDDAQLAAAEAEEEAALAVAEAELEAALGAESAEPVESAVVESVDAEPVAEAAELVEAELVAPPVAASVEAPATPPETETKGEPTMTITQEAPTGTRTHLSLEVSSDGVGTVWFDTPNKKVNLLSPHMLDEIEGVLDEVSKRPDIKAVVFASKKSDNFIAGADLVSITQDSFNVEKAVAFGDKGRHLFQRVAELEVPTVACIHGSCLGGGLELALACDYRVASNSDKTKLGLPEVQLGILPAWGGSQRLPRLIPLPAALDMMLTGKQLKAKKALGMGVIHMAPPPEMLMDVTYKLVRDVLQSSASYLENKKAKASLLDKALSNLAVGQNLVFKQARKGVLDKTKGFYPAPLKILEVVQNGINLPLHEAFKLEGQAFRNLLERSETANLMNLFFISQDLGKNGDLDAKGIKAAPVNMLGVIGAGYMGAGIAQAANFKSRPVRLKDVSYPALLKGMQEVSKAYRGLVKRKRLTQKQADDRMRLITPTTDHSGFDHTDLVIEAVVEKMEVKKAVFQELEKHVGEHTIFATNTSALSINEMAAATGRPDRFVGLHFFGPVSKMPLVEVIVGEQTSDQTLATALGWVRSLGKTPVVIRQDKPGFVVNRILTLYGNEANLLLEEGADIATIDRIMTDFGMPMGIFEVIDLVGVDVAYHTAVTMESLFSAREGFVLNKVMPRVFADQRFGQKNGKGFYIHAGKEPIPDHRYIQQIVSEVNPGQAPRQITGEEIRDRLVLSMLNESVLCLQEGLVQKPGEIDMAMIMGTGFPPFRGGPLRLIDQQGLQFIVNQLEYYAETRGARFAPCDLLKDMAQKGHKFYPLF
jgi:3-hydroxyacyl-CoA dehydrogenase/enoyl-CoA hydratase/3-hydroxybutyryl-CoA epimerase